MSLSEGSGVSSSPESPALGQILAFFGNVGDFAFGDAPGTGDRVASLAVAMARIADLPAGEIDALYFAARLRNAGAPANEAFMKGRSLSDREARFAQWDVPAQSARICESIAALPAASADIVRWQAECWDGTGYPDRLRWSGIPPAAQLLHIAARFAGASDPEEALAAISGAAGQTFGPEFTRIFVTWFHMFGGEIESIEPPLAALSPEHTGGMHVLEMLADRIDRHNETPGRARRIARRVEELGSALGFDAQEQRDATLAALLFGAGEIRAAEPECAQFDALSRLGIETRAANALNAATLMLRFPALEGAGAIVRARAEWYDGTGGPEGLRHAAIPAGARALALAIAYDAMDEAYRTRITEQRIQPLARIETASGTQFDPAFVRTFTELVQARA